MLVFLLKSTACLAIFLAFYKLVLEKESVHQFKRFFLLGALIASFLIPAVVFTEYVDVAQQTTFTTTPSTEISDPITGQVVAEESYFDWEIGLWTVYIIGVIGFGFRFLRNLTQIALRIRKNPKFKENFITRVLLRQTLPPHTFFNYVFLNQRQFEEKHIPQEVLLHEETHAKQRHSLDILLIELAQVFLWFNPIIYFLKSSIKLNHEFLADRAVINTNNDHSQYQHTILSYLSHGSFEQHQSTGIANAINYSSIKKRFTVMKTNTSRKSFAVRSLLVLPLTALLLFGFSEKRQLEKETFIDQVIRIDILEDGSVQLGNETIHFNEITKNLKQNYLQTFDAEKIKIEIQVMQPVHYNTINDIAEGIRTTGIHQIEVFANEVVMDKGQYEENIPITPATTILNANKMTIVGNNVQSHQESASREEMKEYNALAKKYNEMDRNHMVIKKQEVNRLKEIYSKMSKKQQEDAEPFPNFPPPPPAPDAPEPPKNVPAIEPTAPSPTTTAAPAQEPTSALPAPPPPPEPKSPLESIKEMAAKGATFTFNGEEISSEKAIEMVKENKFLYILSMTSKGDTPVVKLGAKPIEIEN